MANGSGGSNALGWVVLGFLAGVAATLGVLTFIGPGHARRQEAPAEAVAPPPTPRIAEDVAPKPPVSKPATQTLSSASASVNATDQQVQEDAAAAGMTSRSHSSEPPSN